MQQQNQTPNPTPTPTPTPTRTPTPTNQPIPISQPRPIISEQQQLFIEQSQSYQKDQLQIPLSLAQLEFLGEYDGENRLVDSGDGFSWVEGQPWSLVMLKHPKKVIANLFPTKPQKIFWIRSRAPPLQPPLPPPQPLQPQPQPSTPNPHSAQQQLNQHEQQYARVQRKLIDEIALETGQDIVVLLGREDFVAYMRGCEGLGEAGRGYVVCSYYDKMEIYDIMYDVGNRLYHQYNRIFKYLAFIDFNEKQLKTPLEQQSLKPKLTQQLSKNPTKTPKRLPNFLFLNDYKSTSNRLLRTLLVMIHQPISQGMVGQLYRFLGVYRQRENVGQYQRFGRDREAFCGYLLRKNLSVEKQINLAIKWYTRQSFVYKVLNNLLRSTNDPTQIFYITPYFQKLFKSIKTLYDRQFSEQERVPLYRGGTISEQQINCLLACKGGVIQNLGFLSTTAGRQTAEMFISNVFFVFQIPGVGGNFFLGFLGVLVVLIIDIVEVCFWLQIFYGICVFM